jgi:adenine/guanine phosphoribosyltransferase-like PRPP-binding protein
LVDDVVTTGATLTAAADAVRKAGLCVMACAVIASTQRRVRKEVAIYTENTRTRSYQPL